ncbi:hypothetical protein [Patulibacter sp. SYSU D01012]|uniref:hypothetical protein n=1 Tax=Patulibacter sp. SYSU D01012 TaxID=2817381 RepID=UPI001B312F48|nr:hypothetical protein [Patulibacter sp. SYSU D01012]
MVPRRLLAAVLLACGALPVADAAAGTVTYDVTMDATVRYDHADAWRTSDGVETRWGASSRRFVSQLHAEAPGVRFVDGVLERVGDGSVESGPPVDERTTGTRHNERHGGDSGDHVEDCEAVPVPNDRGHLELGPAEGQGERAIAVRLTDELAIDGVCEPAIPADEMLLVLNGLNAQHDGYFDAVFALAANDVGEERIVQRLTSGQHGTSEMGCPGSSGLTTSCSFSWEATLTFRRTSAPPPPPPADPPSWPAPESTGDAKIDAVTKAVQEYLHPKGGRSPVRPRTTKDGRETRLELRCPLACGGRINAYAVARRKATGDGTLLGRGRLKAGAGPRAAAGHVVHGRVTLDAKDRKTLRTRGWLRVVTELRFAGDPRVHRVVVTQRAPGRR